MKNIIDVSAAVIFKENKVLAARRKQGKHLAGKWEFPGGKLEAGETPEECLARELYEEFEITARVSDFVGESIYDYGAKIVRVLAYKVEDVSGDFKLIDHDAIVWLGLDDLEAVDWAPADMPLIHQLLKSSLINSNEFS